MEFLALCLIASCAVSVGFFVGAFFSGSLVADAPDEFPIDPKDRYMTITLQPHEYRRLS